MLPKQLVITCLGNFLIAALMGLALRYVFVGELDINYRFFIHAHSHVAMLGWVYLMLYVLMVHYFIPEKQPIYKRLFWLTQLAVVGMALSFPFRAMQLFQLLSLRCIFFAVIILCI